MKNLPFWLLVFAAPFNFGFNDAPMQKQSATKSAGHNENSKAPDSRVKPPAAVEEVQVKVDHSPPQNATPQERPLPTRNEGNHTLLGLIVNGVLTIATLAIAIAGIIQARATQVAAEAAKLSAEVLKESQRPQIAMDASGSPPKDLASRESPRVQMALTNRGTTPAYDCYYESWIELLPFPFDDFTKLADYFKSEEPFSLYPGHTPVIINLPFRNGLTEAQREDMYSLRKYVCVRIRVVYTDAFSPRRFANFGVYILKEGIGFISKYNNSN